MSRAPFVFAVARGKVAAILRALPGCDYTPPADGQLAALVRAPHTLLLWPLDLAVTLPWASSGTAGQWTAVLAAAEPLDWRVGPAAFRLLRRASLAYPAEVRGPWSPLALHRARPALAVQWFGGAPGTAAWHLPWVIEGMRPEGDAAVDYDPSDADCTADTEPDPVALFGGA